MVKLPDNAEDIFINLPIETWTEFMTEFCSFLKQVNFSGVQPILESTIDPATFATRVREFMEGRE